MKHLFTMLVFVFFLSLVNSGHAEVTRIEGLNGVVIDKALVFADPRDKTISYCTLLPADGTENDPHKEDTDYLCIHVPVKIIAKQIVPCLIISVPSRGPEFVCGPHIERYEKEGLAVFGQVAL